VGFLGLQEADGQAATPEPEQEACASLEVGSFSMYSGNSGADSIPSVDVAVCARNGAHGTLLRWVRNLRRLGDCVREIGVGD
jgi:hypothetical protein